MKSLRELYKIGRGPSSSHTMGPQKAALLFKKEHNEADEFIVTLYGSLAKTGKGHLTDVAIEKSLAPTPVNIVFDTVKSDIPHENTMDFVALKNKKEVGKMRALSIGGGEISIVGRPDITPPDIYPLNSFKEIATFCTNHNMRLCDYVYHYEDNHFHDYLVEIWNVMKKTLLDGLSTRGILEGGLKVERKAQFLYNQRHMDETDATRENRIVCAYAFAIGEQNASGGTVVTAPTCGACSVLPAALRYMQDIRGFSDERIYDALAVGGLIGNLVKTNASISGAECGCQAEMGTACSMTAAALCELFKMGLDQIEYAAEVAMEHHLGLTCDPIKGLVQIPCIERGAVAAMRAINALSLANFLAVKRKISFDKVVDTMYRTGKDISANYRETSEGGLAQTFKDDLN